jgi:hypothetical protein
MTITSPADCPGQEPTIETRSHEAQGFSNE